MKAAQMFECFEGYDPNSPTLAGGPTQGDCMGPELTGVHVWFDSAVPIRSGDFVRVTLENRDGSRLNMIKRIECDRADFWYLVADGDQGTVPLILLKPLAFAKVVARKRLVQPRPEDLEPLQLADAEDRRLQELYSRSARSDWATNGYVRPGPVFPGWEAVRARFFPPLIPEDPAIPLYVSPSGRI
jgi:hypothetical protein